MLKIFNLKNAILLTMAWLLAALNAEAQIQKTGQLNVWAKTEVARQKEASGLLITARAARNKGYDRVVFEFKDNLPSYSVKLAKPPFYLGESDKTVKVLGKSYVEVTFTPANAHNIETGKNALTYRKGKLSFPIVQETALIYDFEGMVSFVVGLKANKNFRVMELTNPARLVIDFKH